MISEYEKIPLFGYPLMQYSPNEENQNLQLSDSRGWRLAILTDGAAIKDPCQEDFKMVSTAQLKAQQSDKRYKIWPKNNSLPTSQRQDQVKKPYPAGAKLKIFQDLID